MNSGSTPLPAVMENLGVVPNEGLSSSPRREEVAAVKSGEVSSKAPNTLQDCNKGTAKANGILNRMRLREIPDIPGNPSYSKKEGDLLEIRLQPQQIEPMEKTWGYCLAGIVAGKFPGILAIQRLADSWPSKPAISCHSNGLIYFRFIDRVSMMRVFEGGPYSIYKRPLSLHLLNGNFNFQDAIKMEVDTWVMMHNLPMDFWGAEAMSMITSSFGKPKMMDSNTYHKRKLDYARVLVAVPVTTPPPSAVRVICPLGKKHIVTLKYDFIPKLCSKCHKFGHYMDNCSKEEDVEVQPHKSLASKPVAKKTTKQYVVVNKSTKDMTEARNQLRRALDEAKSRGVRIHYEARDVETMEDHELEMWLEDSTLQSLLRAQPVIEGSTSGTKFYGIDQLEIGTDLGEVREDEIDIPSDALAFVNTPASKQIVEAENLNCINSPGDTSVSGVERDTFINTATNEMIDLPIHLAEEINTAVDKGQFSPPILQHTKVLVSMIKEAASPPPNLPSPTNSSYAQVLVQETINGQDKRKKGGKSGPVRITEKYIPPPKQGKKRGVK